MTNESRNEVQDLGLVALPPDGSVLLSREPVVHRNMKSGGMPDWGNGVLGCASDAIVAEEDDMESNDAWSSGMGLPKLAPGCSVEVVLRFGVFSNGRSMRQGQEYRLDVWVV